MIGRRLQLTVPHRAAGLDEIDVAVMDLAEQVPMTPPQSAGSVPATRAGPGDQPGW